MHAQLPPFRPLHNHTIAADRRPTVITLGTREVRTRRSSLLELHDTRPQPPHRRSPRHEQGRINHPRRTTTSKPTRAPARLRSTGTTRQPHVQRPSRPRLNNASDNSSTNITANSERMPPPTRTNHSPCRTTPADVLVPAAAHAATTRSGSPTCRRKPDPVDYEAPQTQERPRARDR